MIPTSSLQIRLLLFAFFLLPFLNIQQADAQQWVWATNATGDPQYSNADRDIVTDNNGTQFVAGYFTSTITLGDFTLTNPSDYYSNMYLAKIDSAGKVIWAEAFNLSSTYNDALGICLDDSSNIYVTGAYEGKIFVSKFDSSGTRQW